MFKYRDNQKGIALLTVMVIMTVLIITGTLLLRMASSESRIIDDYGDNIRAFYVAEAGIDLAIKQWREYVGSLPALVDENGGYTAIKADKGAYYSQLTALNGPKDSLEQKIKGGYLLGTTADTVSISYSPVSGTLDITQSADTPYFLTITVTGKYRNSLIDQKVRLCYYWNRTTESYKGDGTPVVNPPPPPTNNFTPPISADSWLNTDTNQLDNKWTYDTSTDSITRTFESKKSDSIYTDINLTAPFNINVYASFILSNNQSQWIGSELRVGLGYLVGGTSALMVALTIVEAGNNPKVSLTIRDGNNNNITVPVNFTRTLDQNSSYQILVVSQNDNLSINILDDTGQTFNYTSASTLRPGRLILIDATNAHTDPKFTFPQ